KEIEFAAGADNDPYGFKPTDLVVERDGSLIVADWCDGQRPKRGRGRIYRLASATTAPSVVDTRKDRPLAQWIRRLDSDSYAVRIEAQVAIDRMDEAALFAVEQALLAERLGVPGRMHAVWTVARRSTLYEVARRDSDLRVRIQAVRALADMY